MREEGVARITLGGPYFILFVMVFTNNEFSTFYYYLA